MRRRQNGFSSAACVWFAKFAPLGSPCPPRGSSVRLEPRTTSGTSGVISLESCTICLEGPSKRERSSARSCASFAAAPAAPLPSTRLLPGDISRRRSSVTGASATHVRRDAREPPRKNARRDAPSQAANGDRSAYTAVALAAWWRLPSRIRRRHTRASRSRRPAAPPKKRAAYAESLRRLKSVEGAERQKANGKWTNYEMFPGREFDDLDAYRAAKKQRAARRAGIFAPRVKRKQVVGAH